MRLLRLLVMGLLLAMVVAGSALAGEFDWMKDLDIRAQADPSGFKATLAARFKIGNASSSPLTRT
jgi:hypothetical protein